MALDFPTSPTDGQEFTGGNGQLYVWSDAYDVWIPKLVTPPPPAAVTHVGNSAPSSPSAGQQWFHTELGVTFIYYDDGNSSQWVPSTSPPVGLTSWRQLGRRETLAGQVSVDFQPLPPDINDLMFTFDVTPTANGQDLILQFYNAAGALISTAGNYAWANMTTYHTIATGGPPSSSGSYTIGATNAIVFNHSVATRRVGNSTGIRGKGFVHNIRAAGRVKGCDYQSSYVSDDGVVVMALNGDGYTNVAGALSGLRFLFGGTTLAAGGAINLWGSP